MLKMPIFGQIVEKNIVARTTRTLGTLVASGVPILEALNITRETSRQRGVRADVQQDLRIDPRGRIDLQADEGILAPGVQRHGGLLLVRSSSAGPIGMLIYLMRWNKRIVDDLVVNMVDVGEETGELDVMLYKVADNYDEEVAVLDGKSRQPVGALVDCGAWA